MKVKVTLTGRALKDSKKAIKEAIDKTYGDTSQYAISILRGNTPVVTGRLSAGWEVAAKSSNTSFKIDNRVPYAPFVDGKRQIVERSMSEIENYFKGNLRTNFVVKLNS